MGTLKETDMRKFRIKENANVSEHDWHEIAGIYDLHSISPNGNILLKTKNKYMAWSYSPDEVEEVFETEPNPLLLKDTDLGYFARLAMLGYISAGSTGMPKPHEIVAYAMKTAKSLIEELRKEVGNG